MRLHINNNYNNYTDFNIEDNGIKFSEPVKEIVDKYLIAIDSTHSTASQNNRCAFIATMTGLAIKKSTTVEQIVMDFFGQEERKEDSAEVKEAIRTIFTDSVYCDFNEAIHLLFVSGIFTPEDSTKYKFLSFNKIDHVARNTETVDGPHDNTGGKLLKYRFFAGQDPIYVCCNSYDFNNEIIGGHFVNLILKDNVLPKHIIINVEKPKVRVVRREQRINVEKHEDAVPAEDNFVRHQVVNSISNSNTNTNTNSNNDLGSVVSMLTEEEFYEQHNLLIFYSKYRN